MKYSWRTIDIFLAIDRYVVMPRLIDAKLSII